MNPLKDSKWRSCQSKPVRPAAKIPIQISNEHPANLGLPKGKEPDLWDWTETTSRMNASQVPTHSNNAPIRYCNNHSSVLHNMAGLDKKTDKHMTSIYHHNTHSPVSFNTKTWKFRGSTKQSWTYHRQEFKKDWKEKWIKLKSLLEPTVLYEKYKTSTMNIITTKNIHILFKSLQSCSQTKSHGSI